MLLERPLEDSVNFVRELSEMTDSSGSKLMKLSRLQSNWLSFCISAMTVLSCLNWEKMERASFGQYGARALSWMLHHCGIPWKEFWNASIMRIIRIAGSKGVLVIDDTDRLRAKGTKKLFGVHKVKDKKTAGYSMAQNLVVLVFVTSKLTIPVGFAFFRPDPTWKAWREKDIELRKQGIKKSKRPKKPPRSDDFPMKTTLAVQLVTAFKKLVPDAEISAIAADAAYLTSPFVNGCETAFSNGCMC